MSYRAPARRNLDRHVAQVYPHQNDATVLDSSYTFETVPLAFVLLTVLITATFIKKRSNKSSTGTTTSARAGLVACFASWRNNRNFVVLEDTGTLDDSSSSTTSERESSPCKSTPPIHLEKNSCTLQDYLQRSLHSMDSLAGYCRDCAEDDVTVPMSGAHRAPMHKFGEHLSFLQRIIQVAPIATQERPSEQETEKDVAMFKGAVVEV